jgi:hypothetical protein
MAVGVKLPYCSRSPWIDGNDRNAPSVLFSNLAGKLEAETGVHHVATPKQDQSGVAQRGRIDPAPHVSRIRLNPSLTN